jgi:hypothetical protein
MTNRIYTLESTELRSFPDPNYYSSCSAALLVAKCLRLTKFTIRCFVEEPINEDRKER